MAVPHDDELAATQTEGYKIGQSKTVAELAALDQEDESLQRWKASLGLTGRTGGGQKRIVPKTIFLTSPTRSQDIIIDLTQSPDALAKLKKEPVTIKEGVEYSVGITFVVENEIVSGLRFLQVVKRAGVTVDKTEAMLGSVCASSGFASEESPTGMLARSGSYAVRTRIIDDDGNKWLDDFEWSFKLGKEW
ncbi:uncharacterized protein CcaverHIS019_0310770 [Cutaneotrichosporon cavernicola]|uniref:E set domain-containing protein n=1 Tax=Cutaneotrichosporon cavernicola TaxID=279322 RepID=A0AA48QV58_9TREE|nr:uncharacterized protein CcaverHIS019_0310770 [Cutaneotrichosporon cavernicola]BEI91007.1 hypothetical protein CcaverHIS019_0310770 [Cutaneotrichosporon cavernicola]